MKGVIISRAADAVDVVGDVGFGVIKNSGKMVWGGGQVIVGAVTDNDELVEAGGKAVVGGGIALLGSLLGKKAVDKLFGDKAGGDGADGDGAGGDEVSCDGGDFFE